MKGLGIDVETIMSRQLHDEIGPVYLNDAEMALVETAELPLASTICFSAKEALFKGIYPLIGRFFDFKDAAVARLDYASRRLSIRLTNTLSGEFHAGVVVDGSFCYDNRSVFTAFELLPTNMPVAGQADRRRRAEPEISRRSGQAPR